MKGEELYPMNSKSIAGVLIAGTLVISGGSVLAATLPSRAKDTQAPHPTTQAKPLMSTATYTVKSGDSLSTVARWFVQHGDGAAWAAHEAAIGSESHLLFSGERITVIHGAVRIAPPTQ
jgi:hypothetical protein